MSGKEVVVGLYGLYVQRNVPSLSLSLSPLRQAGRPRNGRLRTPRAPNSAPSRECFFAGIPTSVMTRSDILPLKTDSNKTLLFRTRCPYRL